MANENTSIPDSKSYVQVSLFDGGSFIADTCRVHANVENETFRLYDWAFYVHDPQSERNVIWDVGIGSDRDDYTPWVQKVMLDGTSAVGPRQDLASQMKKRGVQPEQVDTIIFSHAHWDHCRPMSKHFPRAKQYLGPETKEYCAPGHFHEDVQWDGRFFDPENATEKWHELEGPWVPFGPFERAMDFFGNGSFWVIQAPGHMPGNLCAAARLQGGEWVILGSDCCHSRAIIDGIHEIAVFSLPDGSKSSLMADIPAAKKTIEKLRQLEKQGMHLALAHDASWMKKGTDKVLMSLLDEDMHKFAVEGLPKEAVP